jgi:predicted RNA-binding Zn-ribbon protein involved in translation (DUF1610 family)
MTMTTTTYLNPSTRQVMEWMAVGGCSFCGTDCTGDKCRAVKCPDCGEIWLADEPRELRDGAPARGRCAECGGPGDDEDYGGDEPFSWRVGSHLE